MPSPFPGMDPYLEAPEIWRGFHHSLADEIKAQLNAVLSPQYYADVEVRTVLEEVGTATAKTISPNAAVLETAPSVPAGTTAVAIPAAPVQRLAMLLEPQTLRTVQVRATDTDTLVTAEVMDYTRTEKNAGVSYVLTCISSNSTCYGLESGPGGKPTIHRWHVTTWCW